MLSKKFWGSVALTALSIAINGPAQAQVASGSTGSQEFGDEIVITGTRMAPTVGGVITNETAPKSRASIGQDYIATQSSGQSLLQLINVIPGVNFTNNDPFGSSGGNIRIRGFDGNRVSLTWDGMPLNDTGNYAIFSNQLLDAELAGSVTVNMGSTDVDSPTASAVGGTVNYITRRPSEELGLTAAFSGGQDNFRRSFLSLDTGALGPFDTTGFMAGSLQEYEKWKGFGSLEKRQFNARFFQPIGNDGDFVTASFHWNQNRNNNYRSETLAEYQQFGRDLDFYGSCTRPTPTTGTAQTETSGTGAINQAGAGTTNCVDFYGRQVNPSNTGNIRVQSRFSLTDTLTLTVDPSFQYVLADGGGQLGVVSETSFTARGASGLAGFSLNGDGDTLDTVAFFTPSVTNTRRYGVTGSLIWQATDSHRFRVAYTNDYGRHRQTGEYSALNANGTTDNVFGGKDGQGQRVFNADGYHLRARDRFSIATLNQVAFEYRGQFFDDKFTVIAGVRAPFFERDLNQYCYTQINSSNVQCTSATPIASPTPGFVRFVGSSTDYIRPFSRNFTYEKVLPNVGVSYQLTDSQQIYGSFIQGLSAPRTDNLYAEDIVNVKPEETTAIDIGYRYSGGAFQGSATLFANQYKDRIQSAFDDATGAFIDRSIGDVDLWGAEATIGGQPVDGLELFLTTTYLQSELKSDIRNGRGVDGIFGNADDPRLPTAGKTLAESPEWQVSGRAAWETGPMTFGLSAKWVDTRFSTDVNDEEAPAYTTFDLDFRFDFEEAGVWKGAYLQINGTNIFDEDYLGSISSRTNRFNVVSNGSTITGSAPTYSPGAPQTFTIAVRKNF